MAEHKYLDETGLSQVWNKSKTYFADKESVNSELSKKINFPLNGTDGQVLIKNGNTSKWGNIPSPELEYADNETLIGYLNGDSVSITGNEPVSTSNLKTAYDNIISAIAMVGKSITITGGEASYNTATSYNFRFPDNGERTITTNGLSYISTSERLNILVPNPCKIRTYGTLQISPYNPNNASGSVGPYSYTLQLKKTSDLSNLATLYSGSNGTMQGSSNWYSLNIDATVEIPDSPQVYLIFTCNSSYSRYHRLKYDLTLETVI